MGASLRTAWSASGATGASDSNVFVHEDVDFSYEEMAENNLPFYQYVKLDYPPRLLRCQKPPAELALAPFVSTFGGYRRALSSPRRARAARPSAIDCG